MKIVKHIPNAITCGNLLSGCMSIFFLVNNMPVKAAIMIFAASVFDFFDGFAARKLNAHSPIGADLDSLSDVVSFGVAPGFIMMYLSQKSLTAPVLPFQGLDLIVCLAFLLPIFSAIRLARFNVDSRQTTYFIGLPTPAMAIMVASIPLALAQQNLLNASPMNLYLCLGIIILFSFMMISNVKFFSFKMHSLGWKGNEIRYIFLGIVIVLFACFQLVSLPFIMLIYILISLFSQSKIQ